eukprot:294364-Amphidinium_carterae.1
MASSSLNALRRAFRDQSWNIGYHVLMSALADYGISHESVQKFIPLTFTEHRTSFFNDGWPGMRH